MKAAIIALSAAVLAAAPVVSAHGASSKSSRVQHNVSGKLRPAVSGYAPWRVMHGNGANTGYPGAFGYAPGVPKDYTYENSRNAGGGGGGGGGGGSGM